MAKTNNNSDKTRSFDQLKKKYVRSIIKLGNSKAITFPQDWTEIAELEEKSEVSLYPIDQKTIVVRAAEKEKEKTKFYIEGNKWPLRLIKQAIISAFKLNTDEIFLKYTKENQDSLYKILIELQKEIIGFDFKNLSTTQEYYVHFLLDTSKTPFSDVLLDLANIFYSIIKSVIQGESKKKNELLLAEIDRKYSLGRRILITGLIEYPISKGYRNLPIIQFLGDRVVLLYIKDFINEALNLLNYTQTVIKKYSDVLQRIPDLLIELIEQFQNINLENIASFHENLTKLNQNLEKTNFEKINFEEIQIRNSIKYFLNSFQNFFDIGMTRLIESEIGMV